jgi:UDP-glucose 4-epimerase
VLVTGGAGFIGSHVADRFLADGWAVTILDNFSSGRRENVPAGAEVVEQDIGTPEAAALVRGGAFIAICHLAAQIDVRKSVLDPVFDARINILGSLNLLEAVRASGTECRFVFSSTGGAIYGAREMPPCAESASKEPEAPYGTSKLNVENYLSFYSRVHRLDCVTLRYANVYGPRQDPYGEAGVVAIFCGRLLQQRPMTVYGDGGQTRDYVFVGDVARANLVAATHALPQAGSLDARAFNVGTGLQTSVTELAAQLCASSGITVPLKHEPARLGELQRSAVDITKAERVLGWKPTVTLADGLRETFEWFAARHSLVGVRTP